MTDTRPEAPDEVLLYRTELGYWSLPQVCGSEPPKCYVHEATLQAAHREIAELEASLPATSGRDANMARKALGEVMRHTIGDGSIGVVRVGQAMDAMLYAYGQINTAKVKLDAAFVEVARLRDVITKHRLDVWGTSSVGHSIDHELYAALKDES